MKKLFVPIVAMATVFVFTSCGSDEKPTITLPSGDLTIDLGDKVEALKGVTAKDKKDDLTSKIEVKKGLDYVGVGELTYAVSNDNGETTEKRAVTIKPDKLFNEYKVVETNLVNASVDNFNVEVKKSADGTKLLMTNINNNGWVATFVGNGTSMELTMERLELGGGAAYITGSAKYHTENGYEIYQAKYEIEYTDGSPKDKYEATLSKR